MMTRQTDNRTMALTLSLTLMLRILQHSILFRQLIPFTFVVLMWLIHLAQGFLQTSWAEYGVYPREQDGLIGIIAAPALHADFMHLLGNSLPLILFGLLMLDNYRQIVGKVFWLIYISNGILLWLFARDAYHLGASGVVYGLAFFLMLSGFIRKVPRLTMLSFLVIFLYGSMVWGIFPFDPTVSWEAHLYGALSGLIFAIVLRKKGPQPVQYWSDEPEEEYNPSELTEEEKSLLTGDQIAELEKPDSRNLKIVYEYKEGNETDPK